MTQYSRGATFERKVKKEYESEGYLVVRAAGSRGPVDLVAIKAHDVILIQCKIRKPTAAERRKAKSDAVKYGVEIILRWPDGQEVYL